MTRYIIRRFIFGIIVVGIVSAMIFLATRIGPDPALMIASPGADEAELSAIRERFGLNEPLLIGAETGIIPDRLVEPQTKEPAEQDIKMNLLNQFNVTGN